MGLAYDEECLIKFCMKLTAMIYLDNYWSALSPFLKIDTTIDPFLW
jgi:hypothetical protein